MGKTNRNTKPQTPARLALLEKMNSRLNSLKSGRARGSSPQMQKVMKQMNPSELEDSKDMLVDFQKEMKGMKSTKAKKYLKNMMTGMDEQQIENLSTSVKQQVPGSSHELTSYMQQQKSQFLQKEQTKTTINPGKVYTPWSSLSLEEKVSNKQNQQVKKRKSFGKINISVPRISELRNLNTGPEEQEHHTNGNVNPVTSTVPTRSDIDSLFASCVKSEKVQVRYAGFKVRNEALATFKSPEYRVRLQTHILEYGHDVELTNIVQVCKLPTQKYLLVPDSETTVEVAPLNVELKVNHQTTYKNYCFTIDRKGEITRTDNCADECYKYMHRFGKVLDWVISLKNQRIPFKWLCEQLQQLGIFVKNQQKLVYFFYLYGKEYNLKKDKISVPEIPFFTLKVKLQ
jgi:hypothetical protein